MTKGLNCLLQPFIFVQYMIYTLVPPVTCWCHINFSAALPSFNIALRFMSAWNRDGGLQDSLISKTETIYYWRALEVTLVMIKSVSLLFEPLSTEMFEYSQQGEAAAGYAVRVFCLLKIHEQTNHQIQRSINNAGKSRQIFTFIPSKVGRTDCVKFHPKEKKKKPFIFTIYYNKTESSPHCLWNGKHDRVSITFFFLDARKWPS